MKIDDKRFNELVKRVDALDRELDGPYFDSRVAYVMQKVLDTSQAISVEHYINGQIVETRLIKDKLKELEQKRQELEKVLEDVDKQLEKR
jgi:hypothetical protein